VLGGHPFFYVTKKLPKALRLTITTQHDTWTGQHSVIYLYISVFSFSLGIFDWGWFPNHIIYLLRFLYRKVMQIQVD
jgi:hypothetical protein